MGSLHGQCPCQFELIRFKNPQVNELWLLQHLFLALMECNYPFVEDKQIVYKTKNE